MSLRNGRSKPACFEGENRAPGIADNKASIQEEDGSDEELETRRFLLLANVHFMKSITLYH
jgi:hypothetical protein